MSTHTDNPNLDKSNFLGGLIAGKVIEVVVGKALDKVASSHNTDMTKADVPAAKQIVTQAVEKEIQSRVDHVTNNESFFQSRNMWGSFVGIVTAAEILRVYWTDGEVQSVQDWLIPIGAIVTALTPLYSRYFAKKPIGE